MVIVTNPKNVRFIYKTAMVTYSPKSNIFQLCLQYDLNGGRVTGVSNQARIRSLLTYIYRSLDRIIRLLSSKNIQYVVTSYIKNFVREISSYASHIMSLDYQGTLEKYLKFESKFQYLKEMFEDLKIKIQKDAPSDTAILGRISSLERRLSSGDMAPVPTLTAINEQFHGFEVRYHGGICVHKLCFKTCNIAAQYSIKNSKHQIIQCITDAEENIRDDVKIAMATPISINISTIINGAFQISFPVLFSFFHQNVEGNVTVNSTTATFTVKNFQVADNFWFDIKGEAPVTPLSTWESLSVSFYGRSNNTANHLSIFEQKIVAFLKRNAVMVNKKKRYYTELYTNSTNTLKHIEVTKTNCYLNLLKLQRASKIADAEYKKSFANFLNAKELFKSYQVTSYLRNYEKHLDAVCQLKTCPETCLGTNICQVCQKPETVIADILTCQNIKRKVWVTEQEEFDDACNKAVNVYKNIYTGTCRTGGDVSGLRAELPNWAGGIGELIGGPAGAIIGALTGVVVGQFFEGCTNTWEKYLVKEVATVQCKKTRFYTKEAEWEESKCNNFKKKVISQFGVPTSCNCSSRCVMTQEPSCLENNKKCQERRSVALKRMLQSAQVFNHTAMDLFTYENELIMWSKKKLATSSEVTEGGLRYNQSLNDFNQAVKYTQMIHANLEKVRNYQNTDVCLKENWERIMLTHAINKPITVKSQSFGPISFLRKELETNLEIKVGKQKSSFIKTLINTYDVMSTFESNLKDITSKLLCHQNLLQYNTVPQNSPLLFKSDLQYNQADAICNRVLELYEFVRYPITALEKLESATRKKRHNVNREIQNAKTKLDLLKRGGGGKLELSKVDIKLVERRLVGLNRDIERYSDENILRIWRNDMESFVDKTSVLVDYGVVDGTNEVTEELTSLVKFSGISSTAYLSTLKGVRDGYASFYFKERNIKDLSTAISQQKQLIESLMKMTRFCYQNLSVTINQPHRINRFYGDMVTLKCLTKIDKNQNVKFTWYKNKNQLPWQHQSELTFESCDSATYRCSAETITMKNISSEVYVRVESRPLLHDNLSNVTIVRSEAKDTFFFFCNVTATPAAQITWMYQSFTNPSNVIRLNGERKPVLRISKQNANPGFYFCSASNKHASILSNQAQLNVLNSCIAQQAFRLSFTVPRNDVTMILNKIFYSEGAKKAWSVSRTQRITLAVTHHQIKSKVHFKLVDNVVNDTDSRCRYDDQTMVAMVAVSKTNMVQLLRNVLKTMSVQTNENVTIAELREELRSTLLLEPCPDEFCQPGYVLHKSQYKCSKLFCLFYFHSSFVR